jgi:hypothetical protein
MTSRKALSRSPSAPAKWPSDRKHCGWKTSSQSPRPSAIAWTCSAASRFRVLLGATTAIFIGPPFVMQPFVMSGRVQ